MGQLQYDRQCFDIEDRLLAHLYLVIAPKLRRRESFTLTWEVPHEAGGGRNCIWLTPGVALRIQYRDGRQPTINRLWVSMMTDEANSSGNLVMIPEPEPAAFGAPRTD